MVASKKKTQRKVAPGDTEEVLAKEASEQEKKKGNYTRVTRLSWDEVEN